MARAPRFAIVLTVLFLATTLTLSARGANLTINGIAPFDTNLGTLQQVLVTIDPAAVQTSDYQTSFNTVGNHAHTALTPPISIAGLGTFSFTSTATSFSSSGSFGTHNHSFDLLPSIKSYSGSNLAWFLNPANAPVNAVFFGTTGTTTNENHDHIAHVLATTPRTVFTFDPVPEPGALTLLGVGGLALLRRRRGLRRG